MRRRLLCGLFIVAFVVALMPVTAHAQEADPDRWRFAATPFMWLMNISGTLSVGEQEVDVEVDLDQILDALEFAWMSHVEVSKGKVGFFAEPIIAKLGQDGTVEIPDEGPADAEVDLDATMLDFGGAYRVAGPLEIVGGARYFGIDVKVAVEDLGEVSKDGSHWNGFVGARLRAPFGEKWGGMLHGDVGFGDSESNYMTMGALQYRFSPRWGVDLGYKWLHDEVASDRGVIDFDAEMYGAFVGVTIIR